MQIITRELFAECYTKMHKGKRMLKHSCEVDKSGEYIKVLCGTVKLESLCDSPDDITDKPTCQICLRRDPRF